MMVKERSVEMRIRRMADRQGFALRKSRRRDEHAPDYGTIWLLREMVWGGNRWEVIPNPEDQHNAWEGPFDSMAEVEAFLTSDHSDDASEDAH